MDASSRWMDSPADRNMSSIVFFVKYLRWVSSSRPSFSYAKPPSISSTRIERWAMFGMEAMTAPSGARCRSAPRIASPGRFRCSRTSANTMTSNSCPPRASQSKLSRSAVKTSSKPRSRAFAASLSSSSIPQTRACFRSFRASPRQPALQPTSSTRAPEGTSPTILVVAELRSSSATSWAECFDIVLSLDETGGWAIGCPACFGIPQPQDRDPGFRCTQGDTHLQACLRRAQWGGGEIVRNTRPDHPPRGRSRPRAPACRGYGPLSSPFPAEAGRERPVAGPVQRLAGQHKHVHPHGEPHLERRRLQPRRLYGSNRPGHALREHCLCPIHPLG